MPTGRPAPLTALALLAACCAAFAPAPVYREPKPDRRTDEEKLQGTWELASYSWSGKASPATPTEDAAVFAGRGLSYPAPGKETISHSFSLDSAASPKRLDLHDGEGILRRCIYRLDGDSLTLAYGAGQGAARPADFEGGRGVWVKVYRRAKRGK